GDTWASGGDACQYPVFPNDDLVASLPERRPVALDRGPPENAAVCANLSVARSDPKDPTSWERIRLFPSLDAKPTDAPLHTGALRTPVAAFSSGETPFVFYFRSETRTCKYSRDCAAGMECSSDAALRGRRLGMCAHPHSAGGGAMPIYCRDVTDCGPGNECR